MEFTALHRARVQRHEGRLLGALHEAVVEHGRDQTLAPSSEHRRIQGAQILQPEGRGAGHWILPWTCVLALAATVAYAADRAIVASPLEAHPGAAATSAAPVSDASAPIGNTVTLPSVDVEGTRTTIVCLTSPDRVKADVVAIEPEDMATVATNLCRPFPEMIIRPGDPY